MEMREPRSKKPKWTATKDCSYLIGQDRVQDSWADWTELGEPFISNIPKDECTKKIALARSGKYYSVMVAPDESFIVGTYRELTEAEALEEKLDEMESQ